MSEADVRAELEKLGLNRQRAGYSEELERCEGKIEFCLTFGDQIADIAAPVQSAMTTALKIARTDKEGRSKGGKTRIVQRRNKALSPAWDFCRRSV